LVLKPGATLENASQEHGTKKKQKKNSFLLRFFGKALKETALAANA
jgi:hypothetical protein